MDGVAISIIGRPLPLPGHDTPNPAHNTYTLNCEEPDTSYGKNSRFISTTFHAHPKSDAIGFPATGVVFIFAAIVIICNELKLPNLFINSLLILTLLVILISLIWRFSPLPIPRWADARYQYMKRHGMLDKNGDPLPQFELSEEEDS